ncbi:hypothetical protein MKW98_009916 [Papaver atlanticum]|uniref:Uncharacterized protein n=1 Tax=Papaver atlanticum TaxID=357466 RepID=A0AAD4XQZ4_9MAGN|nr:hypothetical protein MKW98_009916 [Papaver atlanticum]
MIDLGFMDGVINCDISISVVQWICYAYRPVLKWLNFIAGHFLDHYIGVYPESNDQLELILGFAKRAGFAAGVVVDFSPQVVEGEFPLAAFMEGRRFLDTKTLTVEKEDKKTINIYGSTQIKRQKVNRFQVARIPPALFRNTGNQTMVFL